MEESLVVVGWLINWDDPKVRELFDNLEFTVCNFSTSVSKTGSGDVWLSYVLDKTPVK